jgi:Tfp pilus assembly protein PilW
VELLIGSTLAAMVMAAVLSSYIFLSKSFIRLANQQILESEARRTLAYFSKDVQAATGIFGSPSATAVTLNITTAGGTTTVAYNYDSTTGTLTRTPSGGTPLVVLRNITDNNSGTAADLTFRYYDSSSNEYTTYTNYLSGIRQISVEFATQTGVSASGTQTLVYRVATGRLLIHNNALLQ